MGIVYEAIDERLGRSVAIKLMRPERSNDEPFRQRFLREAQAGREIAQRPHCPPLSDRRP
jgi:serine/threonine protein kinase